MIIQHNIMAMNAYRNYKANTSALSSNLEKLSSGYKINRAGDDAAGLAISEKMRAQITGLEAAQKNVKDGISLVKTAEGAMQEIQDMLNRMDYLATQSANGTYQDEVDRENLNKEMEALKTEINRIADSANFNGIKLLDGSLDPNQGPAGTEILAGDDSALTAVADGARVAVTQSKAGTYTVNITSLNATVDAATNAKETVSIVVGGVTVAVAAASGGEAVTAGQFGAAASTVTFGTGDSAITASVTVSNGIITITTAVPENQEQIDMLLEGLEVDVDNAVDSTNGAAGNQAWALGVKPTQQAQLKGEQLFAQAELDLSKLDGIQDGSVITIGDKDYTIALGANSKVDTSGTGVIDLTSYEKWADGAASAAEQMAKTTNPTDFDVSWKNDGSAVVTLRNLASADYDEYDLEGTSTNAADATWKGVVSVNTSGGAGKGLNLQIGDSSDSYNQMKVEIGNMHTYAMQTKNDDGTTTSIADIDILTSDNAQAAVDVIKNAINYVSSVRGDLGAYQNRLEHTANNLSVMAENIQDAESTIRDTDVAEEMMSYVKNNILVQSAQAMLAQANQVPQGVLQLLG